MYRIVDTDAPKGHKEVAAYDSAYAALDAMRRALLERNEAANRWRLVAPNGAVLVEPADVLEAA